MSELRPNIARIEQDVTDAGNDMADNLRDPEYVDRQKAKVAAAKLEKPAALLVPVSALMTNPKPLVWVIRGIVEHPTLAMLYGDSGAGKSFVTLSIAASIAAGRQWYGREVKRGPVVYVAGEGHAGISRRLKAWSIHNGVDLTNAPLMVSRKSVIFADPQSLLALVSEIRAMPHPPVMVVIDTVARAMAGTDENTAKDMGAFVQACDQMKHEHDCTVLLVHHTGQAEKNRARGSSALKAALDVEIELKREGDTLALRSTKMKDAQPFDDMGFTFSSVKLPWTDEYDEPISAAVLELAEVGSRRPVTDLRGAKRIALDALKHCLEHESQATPEALKTESLSHPACVVTEEAWRQRCYLTGISDKSPDAKRKAFTRARGELMDMGRVGAWDGVYYIK